MRNANPSKNSTTLAKVHSILAGTIFYGDIDFSVYTPNTHLLCGIFWVNSVTFLGCISLIPRSGCVLGVYTLKLIVL